MYVPGLANCYFKGKFVLKVRFSFFLILLFFCRNNFHLVNPRVKVIIGKFEQTALFEAYL